ncbi:MAG TPA: NAD(P)/FAD-dependent oxidoreductase [Stellaceae bacterium]|nr:NAD(P)/FAD-dependent oxidoreductase [Stellaceae bacterium]
MASSISDIVVVGSGHNGLIAAAYLAVAGKRVTVLERNAWLGGGVVTRELTVPGFRHDQHSMAHIFIHRNPLLLDDDLGLKSRYGLEYVFPDPPMMSVFEDGTTLGLYRDRERTCADIAKFSAKDAAAYRRLADQAQEWLPMIAASLYAPPMPLGASHAMLDQSREGRSLWRIIEMSCHDVLASYFEHEKVRMHFARVAGENLVSPDEKATGLGVFVFVGFLEAHGIGVPLGGSGRLTDALVRCIEAHGGMVLAETDIVRIATSGGRAVAAEAADGRRFEARDAVIGAIHPHLLGGIVEGLDSEVRAAAEATDLSPVACITIHAALKAPLRFKAGDRVGAVMIELLPDRYDTLRQSFDALRYGFSPTPLVGLGSLTMFDPSRAPPGQATLHAWDYVPYARPDGLTWDDTKHDYARRMIEHMGRYIDGLDIISYHCDSPADMERTSPSFRHGDLHGIANTTYQSGAHRPTPDLGQYTVPGIDRLYLVGPFQHPGGGVFGAGRATAMVVAEALGIDFDRIRVK